MSEPHEPHPAPTLEERAAYRVAHYRRPAMWRGGTWACTCQVPRGKKHADPFGCLSEDIVLAHWLAFPKTTYRVVRMLAWLEGSFAR